MIWYLIAKVRRILLCLNVSRCIMGYIRLGSASQMRTELNQDSLSLRCTAHTLNEMYKIINKTAPNELRTLLQIKSYNTNRCLCSPTRHDLELPRCKLYLGNTTLYIMGVYVGANSNAPKILSHTSCFQESSTLFKSYHEPIDRESYYKHCAYFTLVEAFMPLLAA